MIDTQGKEVLPSEFMAAAERNDLLKNIDRWVVGASLSFVAKQQARSAVRAPVARQRARCGAARTGSTTAAEARRCAEPQRLCLQVTEEVASSHVQQVQAAGRGAARAPASASRSRASAPGATRTGLLESLPLDFVKIDGSLMQGLAGSPELQQRVRAMVEAAAQAATSRPSPSASRMPTPWRCVWQLGVQYIQGYFVHEPEEVVLKS